MLSSSPPPAADGKVAKALLLLAPLVPSAAWAWAAARACCSSRCWVRSSSWICGGKAAKNSGLISIEFEEAAADVVAAGVAVVAEAPDVCATSGAAVPSPNAPAVVVVETAASKK